MIWAISIKGPLGTTTCALAPKHLYRDYLNPKPLWYPIIEPLLTGTLKGGPLGYYTGWSILRPFSPEPHRPRRSIAPEQYYSRSQKVGNPMGLTVFNSQKPHTLSGFSLLNPSFCCLYPKTPKPPNPRPAKPKLNLREVSGA